MSSRTPNVPSGGEYLPPMDAREIGRRLRAARGYGGLEAKQAADALNVSTSTLYRIEDGERELSDREKSFIARATGLPVEFFAMSFTRGNEEPSEMSALRRRVEALEERVRLLEARRAKDAAEVQQRIEEEFRARDRRPPQAPPQ